MAGVTLRGVRKSFGKVEVIKGVDLDIAVRPGDRLTLGIRPEHLRENSGAEAAGRVVAVERLGAETYLHVRAGPEDAAAPVLVLRAGGDSRAAVGDIVRFGIPAEACHRFDREVVALGAPAPCRQRGS